MPEVSREEFERCYFELGGGPGTGWTRDYWDTFFVKNVDPRMRFVVEPPVSAEHSRMFIVSDFTAMEYRMIFMTEEAEDRLFDFPGKSPEREPSAFLDSARGPRGQRHSRTVPRRGWVVTLPN